MKDSQMFYQSSSVISDRVRAKLDDFNRGRNQDRGVYAVSLATSFRPYYILWRVFAESCAPLQIRTLGVTLEAVLQRAMQMLQYCNVVLTVVNNEWFEPYYGATDDIMPFGKYKGKHLAEIYYLAPSYILWLADKYTSESRKYERLLAVAKAFAQIHFELTVPKRQIPSVSRFVGEEGGRVTDMELTVLNVRLQVDTYKPDFYVDQNVLVADRDGNRFTFLIKAAGKSLSPKVLHCRSRKIEKFQVLQLRSARIIRHYESHGVRYTRLGYVKIA